MPTLSSLSPVPKLQKWYVDLVISLACHSFVAPRPFVATMPFDPTHRLCAQSFRRNSALGFDLALHFTVNTCAHPGQCR